MKPSQVLLAASLGLSLALVAQAAKSDAQPLFHTAFLSSFDDASNKVVQLAEAFSAEQYDWRPAEGIRSVKDAILHVAGANFGLSAMLGTALPAGIDPWSLEKTVETKAEAVALLKQSIAFAHAAVAAVPENTLGQETEFFGNKAPRMRLIFVIGDHANEHLGQLIAYARTIGVVPPWSQ